MQKNYQFFWNHKIEEKTLIPSLQTKSRANFKLYDWGPWEPLLPPPRSLPRTLQNLTLHADLSLWFLPNSWTSFSYDWLPKFVLNVRKRARFALNVPDRCRRRLLAQRTRGWWTPIVDDRERKGSWFSVPNASIGEYASIDSLRLHISSHAIVFTKGNERFFEFSSEFGWNVVGWEKDRPVGEEEKGGGRRDQRRLSSVFSLSRKETPFLARSRGSAFRQAGRCVIVVCAAAASARHFAGSLSDIVVRIIFWGVSLQQTQSLLKGSCTLQHCCRLLKSFGVPWVVFSFALCLCFLFLVGSFFFCLFRCNHKLCVHSHFVKKVREMRRLVVSLVLQCTRSSGGFLWSWLQQ